MLNVSAINCTPIKKAVSFGQDQSRYEGMTADEIRKAKIKEVQLRQMDREAKIKEVQLRHMDTVDKIAQTADVLTNTDLFNENSLNKLKNIADSIEVTEKNIKYVSPLKQMLTTLTLAGLGATVIRGGAFKVTNMIKNNSPLFDLLGKFALNTAGQVKTKIKPSDAKTLKGFISRSMADAAQYIEGFSKKGIKVSELKDTLLKALNEHGYTTTDFKTFTVDIAKQTKNAADSIIDPKIIADLAAGKNPSASVAADLAASVKEPITDAATLAKIAKILKETESLAYAQNGLQKLIGNVAAAGSAIGVIREGTADPDKNQIPNAYEGKGAKKDISKEDEIKKKLVDVALDTLISS